MPCGVCSFSASVRLRAVSSVKMDTLVLEAGSVPTMDTHCQVG